TPAPDPDLDVRVERGVPTGLPPGSATAIFIYGACFHRRLPIRRLEVLVDGAATQATAHGMPRTDLYYRLNPASAWGDVGRGPGSKADPERMSYRSGFWATVPVRMPTSGPAAVSVRATLADGSVSTSMVGSIEPRPAPAPLAAADAAPDVTICMATYEPDPELFARQVESIRAQQGVEWSCLISDDRSSPEAFEMIEAAVAGDPRFVLSRSPRRLGFYRNFERVLGMVPAAARLIALSDQDDVWYPDKLATLRDALGDARLVYSDQRVVGPDGAVLAESYWSAARTNNYESLASLLVANTVTGAAALFRRDLLDLALPFPDPPGEQYHDQWLALVARSTGRIAYVDRPLYDYVQHGGAALGHQAPRARGTDGATALRRLMDAAVGWRVAYFEAYCRIRVLAETLLARGEGRITSRSRRVLERFRRSDRPPLGGAWLLLRRARRLLGRTETQDGEIIILRGLLWRPAIAALGAIRSRPLPGIGYDARMPAERSTAGDVVAGINHPGTRALATIVEPLELSVSAAEPERINLLIPTIELQHLFGGYITKFNLARKLAEHGRRVRILTVDHTPPLPSSWRAEVEAYAGLSGLFDRVEVAFARDRDAPVGVNPRDSFIATTWWTAEIAHAAVAEVERDRFLYLIQEFEPYTHPMGSWAAYALGTYDLPHNALFSTALLRDFFAERGYGVYAGGKRAGRAVSLDFQNAITAVTAPPVEEMASRERRRLLFYARPEGHGARNMFELGLLALVEANRQGVFGPEWDLYGIGSVEGRDRTIELPGGHRLELLSKRDQGSYAEVLTAHDVGLALMSTPHPSLVPLEMASAGMLTVTNSFETKTPEAMTALSANLITRPPSVDGIVEGLREAVAGVDDYDRRVAGSAVDWSRDWEQSFNDKLIGEIVALLDAT
ncbi:MAG: glycosyltransferase, partial [Solirubrobacterales bacterium]|nr:glycosyltransferase [Solirubrobacterales bacterium]